MEVMINMTQECRVFKELSELFVESTGFRWVLVAIWVGCAGFVMGMFQKANPVKYAELYKYLQEVLEIGIDPYAVIWILVPVLMIVVEILFWIERALSLPRE